VSRLARFIARIAAWLMPPERAEWAEAMRAELEYVERGALGFALGFLRVSLRERTNAMTARTARRLNLALALVVAAAMLAAKWLFHAHAMEALYTMMLLWTAPYLWLSAREARGKI
jgi:hypothetical protein